MNMFSPVLVHEYLTMNAKRFPDKEAIICGEERWTYKNIDNYTSQLAVALMDLGVQRHDRVAVFLDNSVESVISIYGILKAGCAFISLNGTMKAKKLQYIVKNSGATALISHTSKAIVVSEALAGLDSECKIIWVGPSEKIPGVLAHVSLNWDAIFSPVPVISDNINAPDFKLPRCIDADLATLIYTSGSTGEPKGVISSHHNMVSAARSIIQYVGNVKDDIILDVLPLSFDYGLYQVIMAFMFGGTIVLEKSFLFIHEILNRIAREKITGFPIVPTVVAMLLKLQDLTKYDLSSVRYMTNTGAALPVEHIRRLRTLLPHVTLISMYGLTECKRVAYMPPEELDSRPGSVGKAMPNCEVFILDEVGQEVGPGVEGELVIRGSNVMRGYWNDPENTARVYRTSNRFPGEKLLYSGDIFKKDAEGFLYFVGRKDDMIKCKAERVSAREVENVIHDMAGIAEACVIGVPDEILGQAIKAFVVRSDGVLITEKEVLKHCTEHLESFAIPKYVEFIEKLPRTPHGKIDKKALMTQV